MMYWYGDHMSGWGYGLGILGMVLFWGVVILAIVATVRYLGRSRPGAAPPPPHTPPAPPSGSAEQILAERFARGEIDADEYGRRLDTLRQSRPSAPAGASG